MSGNDKIFEKKVESVQKKKIKIEERKVVENKRKLNLNAPSCSRWECQGIWK